MAVGRFSPPDTAPKSSFSVNWMEVLGGPGPHQYVPSRPLGCVLGACSIGRRGAKTGQGLCHVDVHQPAVVVVYVRKRERRDGMPSKEEDCAPEMVEEHVL